MKKFIFGLAHNGTTILRTTKMKKALLLLALFTLGCGIDPEKTYTVYSVTDSNGKTYHNLIRCGGEGYFIDIHKKEYHFHGNFTEIGQEISGKDILNMKIEKE